MVVISYGTIRSFISRYPDAEDALNNWFKIMSKANFANFNQVRAIFSSCDAVGNYMYFFNIKGKRVRLIAIIQFSVRTVYVIFIGTHKQYDKIDASSVKFKKQGL